MPCGALAGRCHAPQVRSPLRTRLQLSVREQRRVAERHANASDLARVRRLQGFWPRGLQSTLEYP
jgi:hypothetical protein